MTDRARSYLQLIGGHRATLALIALTASIVGGGLAGLLTIQTWIWLPGLGLLVNLIAALTAYPSLRGQPWLHSFHVLTGLMIVVAMADALTHFKGRIELTEGMAFSPDQVVFEAGPLHSLALEEIAFVQGGFTIRYAPGMKRRETESTVLLREGPGLRAQDVGDENPLLLAGYRFYTTHNKGFAPVLTFHANGRQATGSVHMPSYPLFSHRQANEWQVPGSDVVLGLWLNFPDPVYDETNDWTFSRPDNPELVVTQGAARHVLRPGQTVAVAGGELTFEGVRTWMGYSVRANSLAPWLMTLALVAGFCLAIHLCVARPRQQRLSAEVQHG